MLRYSLLLAISFALLLGTHSINSRLSISSTGSGDVSWEISAADAVGRLFGCRRHLTLFGGESQFLFNLNVQAQSALSLLTHEGPPPTGFALPSGGDTGFVLTVTERTERTMEELSAMKKAAGRLWSPNARLLIVLSDNANSTSCVDDTNRKAIGSLLLSLWEIDILEALVMTFDGCIYVYNPFTKKMTVAPQHWNYHDFDDYFVSVTRDVRGYRVRVPVHYTPPYSFNRSECKYIKCCRGPEVCARELLLSHLGARLEPVRPRSPGFGRLLANGSLSGLSGEVASGRADVAFNHRVMAARHAGLLAYARVVDASGSCVVVRRAPPLPPLLRLVLTFEAPVWAALLSALVAFALVWGRIGDGGAGAGEGAGEGAGAGAGASDRVERALEAWAALLQQGTWRGARGGAARLGLALWLLLALVLGTAFTAGYSGRLVAPARLPDVDTLEQFVASGLTLLINSNNRPEDLNDVLQRRWRVARDDGEVVEEVLEDASLARAVGCVRARWTTRRAEWARDGEPLFHVMSEPMGTSASAYEVRLGWPLRRALDDGVSRLLEAGLIARWWALVELRAVIEGELVGGAGGGGGGAQVLALEHLQAAFCLLAAGLAVAGATCAAEVALHRARARRKRGKNAHA